MYRFLVVVEKAENNFAAYSPVMPGCVATGTSLEAADKSMHEAIQMHPEGRVEDKLPIPESRAVAEYMAVNL